MENELVNHTYLLEKFVGKGGWTYAAIPEILMDKSSPFGWVRVKGSIDGFKLKAYHLMPMGNGQLFLPVKAEIRKIIKKKAGDTVHVILYADNTPIEIPEELLFCLKEEQGAYKKFRDISNGEQKAFIDWIFSAKNIDTKVRRIVATLNKLTMGKKFNES